MDVEVAGKIVLEVNKEEGGMKEGQRYDCRLGYSGAEGMRSEIWR